MNSKVFYKVMASFYDLLDIIYFRNYKNSPRKAVLEMIDSEDKILDLCTGTATNAINIAQMKPYTRIVITEWEPSTKLWQKILFTPIHILEPKSYRTFIKKDLCIYFARYGLRIVEERHCDYTKVLRVKRL